MLWATCQYGDFSQDTGVSIDLEYTITTIIG